MIGLPLNLAFVCPYSLCPFDHLKRVRKTGYLPSPPPLLLLPPPPPPPLPPPIPFVLLLLRRLHTTYPSTCQSLRTSTVATVCPCCLSLRPTSELSVVRVAVHPRGCGVPLPGEGGTLPCPPARSLPPSLPPVPHSPLPDTLEKAHKPASPESCARPARALG